jgi:DNA-binding response OmpR family regulator
MPRRIRVLVVDDQPQMLNMLRVLLTREGFDVVEAQDALSGLRGAYQAHPDAILLDVMMPKLNGFEVCRRLREVTDAPIIFVTAKGAIEDVVEGFAAGGDDYLVKPFDRSELLSRLRACLRRAAERTEGKNEILFPAASIMLDCGRHELMVENRSVYLTPTEFEVLRLLMRHAGKVLSANAILARVWGPDRIGDPDLVKQYIYQLRQKIEPDPDSPQYIHTVRGEGYYFDTNDLL